MATFLKELYGELLSIRQYLIKIGPVRRKGNILQKKLSEAKLIVQQYNTYIENISKVERLDKSEDIIISQYCEDFTRLYKEIFKLCQYSESLENLTKMEDFDLKVALNLLPVMNDDLSKTQQLIDGIDYYSTVIKSDSHDQLISFVLKSRLSQAAKLKLATTYKSISDLLQDMRNILLPKKSASALQKQLLNLKQNDLSIDNYGKKLSEMFVDLTISQSEGNCENFKILRSINEKQAIRQFSDGLRNRRIGTIVAAQRYESLKDAIQAALDEDISSLNSTGDVLTMNQNNNKNFKNNSRQQQYRNYQRGTYNASRGRGYGRGWQPRGGGRQWFSQSQPRGTAPRSRASYRGNGFYNNNNRARGQSRGQIRVIAEEPQPSTSSTQNVESENQFFRD